MESPVPSCICPMTQRRARAARKRMAILLVSADNVDDDNLDDDYERARRSSQAFTENNTTGAFSSSNLSLAAVAK
jgi:hypothetical protein